MRMVRWEFGVALSCWLLAGLPACSINERANHYYCVDSKTCQANATCVNHFCLVTPGGAAQVDAGKKDAALGDATMSSMDASRMDATVKDAAAVSSDDAGGAEPCTKAQEGTFELCYDGQPANTATVPPCRAGQKQCTKGRWGPCLGEVTPTFDSCDNIDNNCNATIDEGLSNLGSCRVAGQVAGSTCANGTFECHDGAFVCNQLVFAQPEVCNGQDDDCDLQVDEDLDQKCYVYSPQVGGAAGCTSDGHGGYSCAGICKSGTNHCVSGQMQTACADQVTPHASEVCTTAGQLAQDENCNGVTDEGCTCTGQVDCYTGPVSPIDTSAHLPCKPGTRQCSGGNLQACTGDHTPGTETCNDMNVDDDCDGVKDDIPTLGQSCQFATSTAGVSCNGAYQCSGSADAPRCLPPSPLPTEVCNGLDDNCDGVIDNGFHLDSDPANCGACGKKCATGLSCCGGACVDVTKSAANCSTCGNSCGSGGGCCSSTCKSLQTDTKNCGACGVQCPGTGLLGLGAPACSGGRCQ